MAETGRRDWVLCCVNHALLISQYFALGKFGVAYLIAVRLSQRGEFLVSAFSYEGSTLNHTLEADPIAAYHPIHFKYRSSFFHVPSMGQIAICMCIC